MQDFEPSEISHAQAGSDLFFGTTRSQVRILSPRFEKQGDSGQEPESPNSAGLQTGLQSASPIPNCICSVCINGAKRDRESTWEELAARMGEMEHRPLRARVLAATPAGLDDCGIDGEGGGT